MPKYKVVGVINYSMAVEAESEDDALDKFFELSLEDRDGFSRDAEMEAIEVIG